MTLSAKDEAAETCALDFTTGKRLWRSMALQNLSTTPPEHRKLLCVESANCVLSQSACAKRTENLEFS
jgi:hypothetical protein